MKNVFFVLICVGFLAACQHTPTPKNAKATAKAATNFTIVPNVSIGDISPNMQLSDLIQLFGEKNVVADSIAAGEGTYIEGTTIFPNTPNSLRIAWEKGQLHQKIKRIIIDQRGTKWLTDKGITIGTPLEKVIELNGTDFLFWGFDWDYSGSVSSWEGGNFENIGMGLRLGYTAPVNNIGTSIENVLGDQDISSSEPMLKKMQVEVQQLFFYFD